MDLFEGLGARLSPQDVASELVKRGVVLDGSADRALRRLAQGGHSQMPTTYRRHPGLERAWLAAASAMEKIRPVEVVDPSDPEVLKAWVETALETLGLGLQASAAKTRGNSNRSVPMEYGEYGFEMLRRPRGRRGDRGGHCDIRARMDKALLDTNLPGVSSKTYLKAVRSVAHLQQRVEVLSAERDREKAVAYGKSRLAGTISREAFEVDLPTMAFVSYYVSRLGMRTLFTSGSQARPMDEVAQALLEQALSSPTVRVDVIARVLSRREVLGRLDDAQLGELLGVTFEQMASSARVLERAFDANRDRTHMVVRRGDDSSSWNAASRAFNQARTGWLNLVTMMGLGEVLSSALPGKVPALVASDVAAWHQLDGNEQHKDVAVWAKLPLPWDVVLGGEACSSDEVRRVCGAAGIDADKTGWTQPYRQASLEEALATPELVHGVVVSSPRMAKLLKEAGAFSGQAPSETQFEKMGEL